MYPPRFYQETNPEVLLVLIRSLGFGALISCDGGQPRATNLTVLVKEREGRVVIEAHMHRANPQWQSRSSQGLFLFQGPHSYIRPSWYETKRRDPRVAPTWNYATVQAHGHISHTEDRDWLLAHVTELTATNEGVFSDPWTPEDAPTAYIDQLLKGIVGVVFNVESLVGAFKLSQNQPEENRCGAMAGLKQTGTAQSSAVAEMMEKLESTRPDI